ncbi:MAG: TrfA protein [Gammaproteobacteria bacterium]|nr:TrfA protein [Gammaproteobacteria bacterium]
MLKTSDLLSRVAEIKAKAKERTVVKETKESFNVVQLPLWSEEVRGVPNAALRSALFGAIKKGARAYLERKEIHAQEGIRIVYTGARLDQGDLDVWETVLHISRMQALGNECRVTAYQLLKALGKTDTGINRTTLDRRLSRMKATGIDVKVDQFSYEGSLIDEVYRAEESKEYIIKLNPKLSALFARDQFTHVDWSVRHALDGKPLAQWLHGYYASHAKPYPVTVSMLLKLSGSENEDPSSGKQKLKKALEALTEASNANGQTFSYSIEQDIVDVNRKPSTSQRRHLAKKAAKQKKAKP